MSLGNEGIPAVMNVEPSGSANGNNCGYGWGGDSAIWLIILFLIWGGNGWGNGFGGGMGGAYPTEAILQRSLDTQTIIGKLDGINSGLCDGFYAMNTGMLNGFSNTNMAIANGFHSVDNAVCNLGYQTQQGFNSTQVAMMQGFNAAQAQAADCCCKTQTNLMQLGNQTERGFCETNYNAATNTNAIIQNAHNDTDRVLAKLDAMEMSRKDERIAEQAQTINQLQLAASQAAQNNYLVNQLRPCPVPSYNVCNPFTGAYGGYPGYGNAYNNSCCNNGCCNNAAGCCGC